MQGHVVGHLLKRGVQLSREQLLTKQANAFAEANYTMPVWGRVVIAATAVFFTFILISITYSIGHVILTLAMVETPTTSTPITITASTEPDAPLEKDGEKASLLQDVELATVTVSTKPITSKIRSTMRHITEQAGFCARWRGLGFGLFYFLLIGAFTHLLRATPLRVLPGHRTLIFALVSVFFVRIHCAWLHATIAMPSSPRKLLKDRLLPRRMCWRQLALPTAAAILIPSVLHRALVCAMMAVERVSQGQNKPWIVLGAAVSVIIAAGAVDVFVSLPLLATLARIEAALLPEDEDTIVPFDRTYGGAVMPDRVAGGVSPVATFKAAFRSVDGEARRRVVKTYVKLMVVLLAVVFVAVHVVLFETWAIMGDKLALLLMSAGARAQQQGLIHVPV